MITFKPIPLESDMATLSYLKENSDNIVKSMIVDIFKSQTSKVEKEVEVHGKSKTFWRKQLVNVDGDNKSSKTKPPVKSVSKTSAQPKNSSNGTKTLKPLTNTTLTLEQKKVIKNNGKVPAKNLPMHMLSRSVVEDGVRYRDLRNIDSVEAFFGYDKKNFTWDKNHSWGKWVLSRTKRDIKAIDEYTGGELTYPTNCFLRQIDHYDTEDGKYNADQVDEIGMLVRDLDCVIATAEVVEPFITYRKMRRFGDDGKDLLEAFKNPDGIYQDNGYISTSPLSDTFDIDDENGVINMRIRVPTGKGIGAWVRPYSQLPDEYEFLLARGSQFKVLSITEADGETNVELEWIGVAEKDFGDIEDEMDERGMIKYEDYMGVEYDDE